jgi:hypothetical protein
VFVNTNNKLDFWDMSLAFIHSALECEGRKGERCLCKRDSHIHLKIYRFSVGETMGFIISLFSSLSLCCVSYCLTLKCSIPLMQNQRIWYFLGQKPRSDTHQGSNSIAIINTVVKYVIFGFLWNLQFVRFLWIKSIMVVWHENTIFCFRFVLEGVLFI